MHALLSRWCVETPCTQMPNWKQLGKLKMTDGLDQSSVSSTSRPKKFCDTCNTMLIDNYICCHKCESVYFCNNKCE